MGVYFTRQAELDLEDIGDTIAADNPSIALRFIRDIRAHCERITATPLAYPARPELGPEIRCCVHQRYLILFQSTTTEVLIVRVLHGSRDLLAFFADN
ncbi:MAG: type II toxin-antitoxin system RelE/ParE family toxin [Prochlorococcaceae cyanobacterium]